MAAFKWLARRLYSLLHPDRVHNEIAEELSFHIQQRTEENMRAGMSAEEARQEAQRRFGHLTQIREQGYEVRGGRWLESFLRDVFYGLRVLRRNPVFTLTAVVTLALGIGVNTALFAVVESVLLRPLPYNDPEKLYMVREKTAADSAVMKVSNPDFDDIHDQGHSFDRSAEVLAYFTYTMTGEGEPQNVKCTAISFDFFPMLGIRPLMGRLYTPEEYHIDGGNLVISEKFWREKLGSDPHVIGRNLKISGEPLPIIGVMPDLPDFLPETEVWAKMVPELEFMHWRQNKFVSVVGHLRKGVSREQAEQEMTTILRRAPGQPKELAVVLLPLKQELVGKVSTQLKFAMGAVLVVLLITCVNMMGLLLARASDRGAEVAMRLSLGAKPVRILRQFVTENLLLVSLGSLAGMGLAEALVRVVRKVNPANLPRTSSIGIDGTVMGLAIVVTLAMSLLLAWGPSILLNRLNVHAALKTGRAAVGRPKAFRLLVVSEMGCAVVLLIVAGLLLRSLWLVQHVDPGFAVDHVLYTYLRTTHYSAEGGPYFNGMLERLAQTPGVRNAALADCVPASRAPVAQLTFDDRPVDPAKPVMADGCWASPNFLATMETRLEQGRFFTAHDNASAPPVVIVNETLAREYWPGQNPLGKRVAVAYTGPGRRSTGKERLREVVGVVEDMRLGALDAPVNPALYLPYQQDETNHVFAGLNLFVRTSGSPVWMADTVRKQIRGYSADQTIGTMSTMDDVLAVGFSPRRLTVTLLGSFAALALLLAAVGLYGMIAFSVSQRTREIGLRMALGATRGGLLGLIVREGLVLAGTGVALGILLSTLCTRAISSMLFRTSTLDPFILGSAAFLLITVAATASLVPACKAAFVEPMEALRAE
jgi:predicted permease